MKAKIILMLFTFLLIGSIMAMAGGGSPVAISGRILGDYVSNVQVNIENLRTGDTASIVTVGNEYLFDWVNSERGYFSGDQFKIEIAICSAYNPKCTKTETYDPSKGELFIEWDLADVFNVPPEGDPLIQCLDGSIVSDLSLCPEIVEPEPEPEDKTISNIEKTSISIEAFYGQEIDTCIGKSKLSKLQDQEIEFKDNDYDISEEICFNSPGVQTSIDITDYELDPYLILEEAGIEYRFIFEKIIPIGDITEDDPLKINLLNVSREIVAATATKITMISGKELWLTDGAEAKDGIILDSVTRDNEAYILYKGQMGHGKEGEFFKIDDREFYIVDIMNNEAAENNPDKVEIRYAADVRTEIEDGDDYEDGEIWKWIVKLEGEYQYIGIYNQQEYRHLDEDYTPLGIGNVLNFPNDFAQIKFRGITEQVLEELRFRVIDGEFRISTDDEIMSFGTEDYDKIYVRADGFYDEDKVFITAENMGIGDSDIELELGSLKIGNIEIDLDMSYIKYAGEVYSLKEDDYLDHYGLIFTDPKYAVDNKRGFKIQVPEERPEATITIGAEITDDEGEVRKDCTPVKSNETKADCEDCDAYSTCSECAAEECPLLKSCFAETESDCPEKEGGATGWIGYIIALILSIGGGFKIYRNRKGGITMLHRHKKIRAYHDPNVKHKNPEARHALLKDNPKQFYIDVKRINES